MYRTKEQIDIHCTVKCMQNTGENYHDIDPIVPPATVIMPAPVSLLPVTTRCVKCTDVGAISTRMGGGGGVGVGGGGGGGGGGVN